MTKLSASMTHKIQPPPPAIKRKMEANFVKISFPHNGLYKGSKMAFSLQDLMCAVATPPLQCLSLVAIFLSPASHELSPRHPTATKEAHGGTVTEPGGKVPGRAESARASAARNARIGAVAAPVSRRARTVPATRAGRLGEPHGTQACRTRRRRRADSVKSA